MRKEVLRFIVVGTTAVMIHCGVYWLLLNYFNANLAFAIGYVVSFFFNFFLTSIFTFQVKVTLARFLKFSGSHVVNYAIQALLLTFFLYVGVPEVLAPVPVYCISVPVNFLLVRLAVRR